MDSMTQHLCPVCGYDLGFPPWDENAPSDEICPSCGIQFGYDDAAGGQIQLRHEIYQQRRQQWIADGMSWYSVGTPQPKGWDPIAQLTTLGADPPPK